MTSPAARVGGRTAGPSLRRAAPAVLLYAGVRLLGLVVLAAWPDPRSAVRLLVRWDAQWYREIAENGYGLVRLHEDGRLLSDVAFFPLFPALERLVADLAGLPVVHAGLLVSALASLAAAWGIFATGDRLHGQRVGTVLVLAWAVLPVGVVTSMAYSEALFVALAAWGLVAVLDRRWVAAGLLGIAAGLTRPVGVAVALAVLAGAVVALRRRPPGPERRRILVGALLAPLGTVGYLAWVGLRTGRPLGYFEVAAGWGNGFDGGAAFGRWVLDHLAGPRPAQGVLLVAAVAGVAALLLAGARQRQPVPLLVYSTVLVALAFTTSGYFGSKPRYLLPAYPLLLPVALALARLRRPTLVAGLAVAAVGSAVYGALWLHGPGPP